MVIARFIGDHGSLRVRDVAISSVGVPQAHDEPGMPLGRSSS